MNYEKKIIIGERILDVLLTDEPAALSAAQADGRVAVGLEAEGKDPCFGADYVWQLSKEDAARIKAGDLSAGPEEAWLERIVRRSLGLPWTIAETERLVIRELTKEDAVRIPEEPEDEEAERILRDPEKLEAYIESQYRFYECGMWALIRKEDQSLIGLAGFTPEEEAVTEENPAPEEAAPKAEAVPETGLYPPFYALGYHIFLPYRRRGYAKEACRQLLSLIGEEYGGQACAYVRPENEASKNLLRGLGFICTQTENGSGKLRYQHAGNCGRCSNTEAAGEDRTPR